MKIVDFSWSRRGLLWGTKNLVCRH